MKNEIKIEAGNEINSRCQKCKDITNHTIIAMVDGKVAKVQCNVCGGRHNYRPEKPEKPVSTKKKTTRATSTSAKLAKAKAHFEELVAGREPSGALAYTMDGIFKKGDLVDHPTFGLGVVAETIMPNKIEVVFRQENKILICGRLCK